MNFFSGVPRISFWMYKFNYGTGISEIIFSRLSHFLSRPFKVLFMTILVL